MLHLDSISPSHSTLGHPVHDLSNIVSLTYQLVWNRVMFLWQSSFYWVRISIGPLFVGHWAWNNIVLSWRSGIYRVMSPLG